ncbi:hypothetical protein B0H11DRAFT_1902371 [Mycena galericulata]|nr:hypothetical protein B0H11DRAFT_1902371 [Mycena galericulata]
MTLTRKIFSPELSRNQTDSGSAVGRAASFFRVVQGYKKNCCPKSGCSGILKELKDGPSKDGKLTFIGSKWIKKQKWDHHYAALPADVDKDVLAAYRTAMSRGIAPDNPIRDMANRKIAPTYTSAKVKPSLVIFQCVVIFRNFHSHPPWPMEKPGHAVKEDVKKCMDAGGILGETGGNLNNTHTTQAILGTSIDVKYPAAFRDARRLRDTVSHLKSDAGLLWEGIFHWPSATSNKFEWRVRQKITVAMNPEFAALIHDAGVRYLEGDITFKRTKGEMDEWEAAVWYTPSIERITIATFAIRCYFLDKDNIYRTGIERESFQGIQLGGESTLTPEVNL